jgi:hypothetical protein
MSDANFQIKIGVETQLAQLKAMEAQFEKQIVQLRTLGTGGADALKKVETNLSLVRSALVQTASASGATGVVAGGAFKNIGQTVGQAGYQMQDFAVQVAGGQSALTAFAQQGSQLLGIFGPTGIIAGAVLAVGVLAVKMLDLGDNTKVATSKFKTQAEAVAALIKARRELIEINDPSAAKTFAAQDVGTMKAAYEAQQAKANALRESLNNAMEFRNSMRAAQAMGTAGRSRIDELYAQRDNAVLGKGGKASDPMKSDAEISDLYKKLFEEIKKATELKAALTEVQVVDEKINKAAQDARDTNADLIRSDTERLVFLQGKQAAAEAAGKQNSVEYITRQGQIITLEKQLSDEQLKNVGKLAREQINLQIKVEDSQRKQIQNAEKLAKAEAEKLATMRADQVLADAIAASKLAIAKIEADRMLDDVAKNEKIIPLLEAQNVAIQKRIDLLKIENGIDSNPVSVQLRQGKIEKLTEQQGSNTVAMDKAKPYALGDNSRISASKVAADNSRPNSIGRGVDAGLSDSINQFGTDAQIVAGGVQASFQGAFQGISTSLQGLINGTMTWGDALRNISSTIMNSIIGAISDMFAKWLVGRAAQGLASIAWTQAETAAVIEGETASLPVKTAGAVASGISSYGLAIAGGIAALALIASASGAFAEGGPVSGPGTGTSDSIPAWLSNGEYVMPADKTAQYRPLLDSMRAGTLNPSQLAAAPSAGGGSAAQSGSSTKIAIHAHYDQQAAVMAASRTSDFENVIVDMVARNFHRIAGTG